MTQPDKWYDQATILVMAGTETIATALRSAYAEGERAGMERAAVICDGYKWECVKSAEHDPEPQHDRAASYACQECIDRIRAAKETKE